MAFVLLMLAGREGTAQFGRLCHVLSDFKGDEQLLLPIHFREDS